MNEPSVQDSNVTAGILEHFIFEGFVAPRRRKQLDDKAAKVKQVVPAKKKAKALPKPP
jgi:hypothetical protein